MRNSGLAAFALTILIGIDQECFCQKIVIGTRDELYFSVGSNFPVGPKNFENEPSLLANMKSGQSIDVRYVSSLSRSLYAGAWAGLSEFSNWSTSNNPLYLGTSMTFLSAGPSVMYKPWASGMKSIHKLNFCVSLSPGVSQLKVNTSRDSEINAGSKANPLKVQSLRFTIGAKAGLNCILTNSVGVTLQAGYQYTVADSKIFPDKSFSYINLSLGVFYRLFKDKRYKYSGS